MPAFNRVILCGYLTRDPEQRATTSGNSVASFTIAVNRNWTTESGEKREEVTFVDCTAFGKTAETIAKWFTKGKPMLAEGRLRQESWDDKQTGAKRSKLSVIVESFSFVESAKEGDGSAPARQPASQPRRPSAAPADTDGGPIDDGSDIPF